MKTLKSFLITLTALITLNGCINDRTEDNVQDTVVIQEKKELPDVSDNENKSVQLPYVVNYNEGTGRFSIEKNPKADSTTTLTKELLVKALKKKYPEIGIQSGLTKKDTLEVSIDDATYLTQSIGSAGANNYLAEATFAFTSLDSIKVVNFLFKPGDHAMPGPYSRKSFDDFH